MANWFSVWFSLIIGVRLVFTGSRPVEFLSSFLWAIQRERIGLQKVVNVLHGLQETLEAGMVPDENHWLSLRELPEPWQTLLCDGLEELRASGASLLPTIRRIRALAKEQSTALLEAQARSSQAWVQALACGLLVPVFGAFLYAFLPGMKDHAAGWLMACVAGLLMACVAMLWLVSMAARARWGGLLPEQRSWFLAVNCTGERLLGLIRAGHPADIAWQRSCEPLARDEPKLASLWGSSVWSDSQSSESRGSRGSAAQIVSVGSALRRAIQVSLMEGTPCVERIEGGLEALKQDFKVSVERELSLLGTRALKPLFFCVAPSVLGQLVVALYFCWGGVVGGFYEG